jgi:hypothetical protein
MSKTVAWVALALATLLVFALLLLQVVPVLTGLAAWAVCLIVCIIFLVGPETVSEVSFWKASIKRDVQAAREIREDIQASADRLRKVVRLVVENSYILACSSFLAAGGERTARERLEKNLDVLTDFAGVDTDAEDAWWAELKGLFPGRKPQQ